MGTQGFAKSGSACYFTAKARARGLYDTHLPTGRVAFQVRTLSHLVDTKAGSCVELQESEAQAL